ncbi:hypothetical protein AQ490_03690 [Wenjunlia vitaminophila]|uniref:SURF1-like protein n=1 Tax=Wenjunlia vitaminophila TaxID=76728 RepID=A0A0T6LT79_WENVI|nr:SURF1 family protein [Wenjunlia vitaminophila]KRV49306.1 hypothetical protein AQ490_03690 [Wenjunlia vitaminophila]
MSYRFLLSRRWLLLTLLGLVLIPVMVKLGFWQFHRHEDRVANNDQIAATLKSRPVPVGELTAPGREVSGDRVWRSVTATGRYDTRHEVVARQRTAADEATIGYFVITPLVMDDGNALLVNRGWVSPGNDITTYPDVPPAPRGEVTVTGRLRPDETTGNSGIKNKQGLPDRQIMLINSELLAGGLPYPLVGGYVELSGTSPQPKGEQPELVPGPDHSSIGNHLAYAIQWWLFTAMVPVGWVVLARREHRDLLAQANGTRPPAGGAAGPGGTVPAPAPDADQRPEPAQATRP